MDNWFGPLAVLTVDNSIPEENTDADSMNMLPLKDTNLKFVHYPDCQQLIIWLPNPGREYEKVRLIRKEDGAVADEWPVEDKLSGSVQLLWDTLFIPPGDYTIEIYRQHSCWHRVAIKKYKEGEAIPVPEEPVQPDLSDKEPIVYHDGTGKIIENEDLNLRDKLIKEMADRFSRHIEYQGEGRGGYVIYVEGDLRISFYYEFGGGKCIASIDIPTEKNWEKETGLPLLRREEIIQFTANSVQAKQAPRSLLKITGNTIEFWEK